MENKKIIVITGASYGIGKTTAKFLEEKGYIVYKLARTKMENDPFYISCDITKKEDVKNAINIIYEKEKRIDVLVNNAGIGVSGAIELSTYEELNKIINVNFIGAVSMIQEVIPYLRKTKGKIINIGSVAGELTIPFQAYYSCTKAALSTLTEALRMELRPFDIKVSIILPGDTKTSFTKNREQPFDMNNTLYKERIESSLKRMEKDEQNGKNPKTVAKVIYRVIKKKNPPIKVTVGFSYKLLVFLKRLLPTRFINYILYNMYGK